MPECGNFLRNLKKSKKHKKRTRLSDYCIFYYDENYQPEVRKYSKRSIGYYQPKSGTALAYNFAKQRKKTLINIFK